MSRSRYASATNRHSQSGKAEPAGHVTSALWPDHLAHEVGAPTSSLVYLTNSLLFRVLLSIIRQGCQSTRGFCFSKSFNSAHALHTKDEYVADLVNRAFAKMCEFVWLFFSEPLVVVRYFSEDNSRQTYLCAA